MTITTYKSFENGKKIRLSTFLKAYESERLHWSFLYLDSTVFKGKLLNLDFISKDIKQASPCHSMTWEALLEFESDIDDIHDVLLVGAKTKELINHINFTANDFEKYDFTGIEIAIELFDSSYWQVYKNEL
jgi:hypothetical protein